MYLTELEIQNYRNYKKQFIEFSPENNYIVGDNGQGKTNLIEAIYILGMAKSFRITTDKDLIKKGENFFYIKSKVNKESGEANELQQLIELGYDGKKKNAKLNGETQKRLSDWVGNLKVMVFLNQDILLILGSSQLRRQYMDMVISLSNNDYLKKLQHYLKVVKNRNKLLKEEKDLFNIYDNQLIEYGSYIIHNRIKLFNSIKDEAQEIYRKINPDIVNFALSYKSSIGKKEDELKSIDDIKSVYKKSLKLNIEKDIRYKNTCIGPHRDDFTIRHEKEMFKKFASQGQTRVAALTLKMIALRYIENISGYKVILLLDDILLDLDTAKKNLFLDLVKEHQCFFTSTNTTGIGNIEKSKGRIFKIKSGNISVTGI